MLTNPDISVCQIHSDTALLLSKCFILHRYFLFAIDFETYYPQPPQRPLWVHSMCEEILKLRPKRLPIQDTQIHEQFKKFFGYKMAIKCRVSRTPFLCFNLHYFICFCTHIKSVRNIDRSTGWQRKRPSDEQRQTETNWLSDEKLDDRTDGSTDEQTTNRKASRCANGGLVNRWVDGWMNGQLDR